MEGIETFNQVNLGETGVGKTHFNIETIELYLKAVPSTGKIAMKVLILDFQNEDAYRKYKTLKPSKEAVIKFVNQKTIEARRITPINEHGQRLTQKEKLDIMAMVADTFKQGMIVYDDIDAYASFGSSSNSELIGSLMGNRHKGIDNMFSHQCWRKIGVTEAENLTIIRLHHTTDSVQSLDKRKQSNFPFDLCMIAQYCVETQYKLAHDYFKQGKINSQDFKKFKSYHVYINIRSKKISNVSENNFRYAVRRYCSMYPKVVQQELNEMVFEEAITHADKKRMEVQKKAVKRLEDKFTSEYLIPQQVRSAKTKK